MSSDFHVYIYNMTSLSCNVTLLPVHLIVLLVFEHQDASSYFSYFSFFFRVCRWVVVGVDVGRGGVVGVVSSGVLDEVMGRWFMLCGGGAMLMGVQEVWFVLFVEGCWLGVETGNGEEGVTVYFLPEVWCSRDRAVWCGRADVVCTLCFTFLGRVVCGVWWGFLGSIRLCGGLV